ncbi:hypothetical protein SAMN05421823_110128 [Catalinimonas alkaloidigena]|uniref:Uncharacterized protein n=1 Tax=Catalinimonas alkaloidigena TaxID=1075417 RepID=A0A1G9QDC3_9BACT|nr:hypothetical protein [Catalinimonas alkaloidigena]SDM08900.1 hypothetical protein SAMN05421823_110128 [Catalinimonas alkaloidigena]
MLFRSIVHGVFTVLLLFFAYLLVAHRAWYLQLLADDQPIEWITAVTLFVTALLALTVTYRPIRRRFFYAAFAAVMVVAAVEEIDWGQHFVSASESTATLSAPADEHWVSGTPLLSLVKTRPVVTVVLFLYGILLPFLYRNRKLKKYRQVLRLVKFPPAFLYPWFLVATLCMLNLPTGREAELGQLFFALSLLVFMLIRVWHQARKTVAEQALLSERA